MDPNSKRRYRHYKKNNKKSQPQDLEMEFDEEAKFKLERFMDDVRKFTARSKKRKENLESESSHPPFKKQISVHKGIYENTVVGKPSYVSVKEILGDKYKARQNADMLELAGIEKETTTEPSRSLPQLLPSPKVTQVPSSSQWASTPLTRASTQPIIVENTANRSYCTWSTPPEHDTGVGDCESIIENRRLKAQEIVAAATEQLVLAIAHVKNIAPRYPDYQNLVKMKIIELCENRFMGELRKNALSSIGGGTEGVVPSVPAQNSVDLSGGCSSISDTHGEKHRSDRMNFFTDPHTCPSRRKECGSDFFDDGLWREKLSSRVEVDDDCRRNSRTSPLDIVNTRQSTPKNPWTWPVVTPSRNISPRGFSAKNVSLAHTFPSGTSPDIKTLSPFGRMLSPIVSLIEKCSSPRPTLSPRLIISPIKRGGKNHGKTSNNKGVVAVSPGTTGNTCWAPRKVTGFPPHHLPAFPSSPSLSPLTPPLTSTSPVMSLFSKVEQNFIYRRSRKRWRCEYGGGHNQCSGATGPLLGSFVPLTSTRRSVLFSPHNFS